MVDDEDFELVSRYRWSVSENKRRARSIAYAQTAGCRADGRPTTVGMHKMITGYPQTDHRNGDGLDNRRENLRAATTQQNIANSRPHQGCSSQFKGVSWDASHGLWLARIRVNYRERNLGRYRAHRVPRAALIRSISAARPASPCASSCACAAR